LHQHQLSLVSFLLEEREREKGRGRERKRERGKRERESNPGKKSILIDYPIPNGQS